jgi:hypothetical protein
MDRPYEELLEEYVAELRVARDAALEWWNGLLRAEDPDPTTAQTQVRLRWPAGPATFPRVIHVYRKFYLRCEALNDQREAEATDQPAAGWGETDDDSGPGTITPQGLLLDSIEAVDPELNDFMSGFVFSPIGIDDQGKGA